jgi:hypothetical protein
MLPTNATTISADVQPKHDATTAAKHCVISAKTRACPTRTEKMKIATEE